MHIMSHRLTWERKAQIAVVLLCALTLKLYYSAASVNDLRWILAPTTLAVELVSNARFTFESYSGYVNSDHTFVIAASCSGVNFFITAFLMLAFGQLWRAKSSRIGWRFLPCSAACAYLATVIANTVRITTALQLHGKQLAIGGLNPNQLHRFEGIFIYFGFLLLLFMLSERNYVRTPMHRGSDRVNSESAVNSRRGKQYLFPLAIYYATTLAIPFANAALRGTTATDFWEHAAFVVLTPMLVILPLLILRNLSLRFVIAPEERDVYRRL
jgi:exosortase K